MLGILGGKTLITPATRLNNLVVIMITLLHATGEVIKTFRYFRSSGDFRIEQKPGIKIIPEIYADAIYLAPHDARGQLLY